MPFTKTMVLLFACLFKAALLYSCCLLFFKSIVFISFLCCCCDEFLECVCLPPCTKKEAKKTSSLSCIKVKSLSPDKKTSSFSRELFSLLSLFFFLKREKTALLRQQNFFDNYHDQSDDAVTKSSERRMGRRDCGCFGEECC